MENPIKEIITIEEEIKALKRKIKINEKILIVLYILLGITTALFIYTSISY